MSKIDKNVKKMPDLGYILPVTDSTFLVKLLIFNNILWFIYILVQHLH